MRRQSRIRLLEMLRGCTFQCVGSGFDGSWDSVGATPTKVACRTLSLRNNKGQSGDLSRCSGSGASLTGASGVEKFTGLYATVYWKWGRTSVLSSPKVVFVTNNCPKLTARMLGSKES